MGKKILFTLATALLVAQFGATADAAAPYYARGEFNGWGTSDLLTDMGGGHWQGTVSGLTAGNKYYFKLADADWTEGWPGSDARLQAGGTTATFHLYLSPPSDGWQPVGTRVGYEDTGIGWDIMGSFDGWSSPVVNLTDGGGGVHFADYVVPSAGSYEFKFRKAGDWDISIGGDFGNSAGNASVTTTSANQAVRFLLDLPNGRWTVLVPEPSTMLLGLSCLCAAVLPRRR